MRWGLVLLLVMVGAMRAEATVRKGSSVRITRNSGATVLGTVVSETNTGFIITNGGQTELVPFTDIRSVDDLTPASEQPPPPPPPGVGPPPPPPPPEPQYAPAPRRDPDAEQEDAAPRREEPKRRFAQFGIGVSGGGLPGYYGFAWGVGADLAVSLNMGSHFALRFIANYTHVENGPYSTNLGLAIISPSVWFGPYGLAVAGMVGAGDISRRGFGLAFGAFFSPIRFRFGIRVTNEIALDGGVVFITSDTSVQPFGRLAYTFYF